MSRDLQYVPFLKFLGPRIISKSPPPLSVFLGTDMVCTFISASAGGHLEHKIHIIRRFLIMSPYV